MNKAVLDFAKSKGYSSVKRLPDWKGFQVYEPLFSCKETRYIGLPLVILVKGKEIRMSTANESFEILDTE